MNLKSEWLAYVNPIFFYYSLIYAVSKCSQWVFNTESFLQLGWNRIVDVFGEDVGSYSVWILNSYSYLLYWGFGLMLLLMERFHKPTSLKDYKIQIDKSDVKNETKLSRVS